MIFYLSALPTKTFCIVQEIFTLFAQGKLKDQVISRSKKGIDSIPELKGSAFKPLRGLDPEVVHDLLTDLSSKNCSFKEIIVKCHDIKALQKVQVGFVRGTNCTNWEEAVQKYPKFATAEKLEAFKSLDYQNGRKIPEKLLTYCQYAREMTTSDLPINVDEDHERIFVIPHKNSLGLLWHMDMMSVNPEIVDSTLKVANISRCSGFHVSIIDLVNKDEVCNVLFVCVCTLCTYIYVRFCKRQNNAQ